VPPPAITELVRALADVFMPRYCIICGREVDHRRSADICPKCEAQIALPRAGTCPKCCAAVPRFGGSCPNCHNMSLAMNESTAFGVYAGALRDRIIEFKFSGARHLARTFGYLAARAVSETWPDVRFDAVSGVPLHATRFKQRGFDQAQGLAAYAARALGARYRPGLIKRVRPTESQVGLTKSARIRNVKDAFTACRAEHVLTALVLDDIMTTGATMSAACRALKRAGVKTVYAAVVARAAFAPEDAAADVPTEDRGGEHEDQP